MAVQQFSGSLPQERRKQSLPFTNVCLDLFGPINVRLTMSKTDKEKTYGVLITCMFTTAIHLDVASEYSTEAFLEAFRTTVRRTPEVIFTEPGTQMIIQAAMRDMDCKNPTGAYKDTRLEFAPGGALLRQGCAGSLKNAVKKCLFFAVARQTFSIQKLQTVLFEAANLINSRPIGRHPSHLDNGCYLSPNEMLLRRQEAEVFSSKPTNEKNWALAELGEKRAKWILEEMAVVVRVKHGSFKNTGQEMFRRAMWYW